MIGFGPLRLLSRAVAVEAQFAEGPVADLGCGARPYSKFFDCAYLGFDLGTTHGSPDVVCVAEQMPIRSMSVRTAISTQQLEHVSDPDEVLCEAWRILEPGGRLLLSTHGVWAHHPDPVDYWRWTEEGLMRLLDQHDFGTERIHRLGGSVLAGALLAAYPLSGVTRSRRRSAALAAQVAIAIVNLIAIPLDWLAERLLPRHYASVGYLVVATKVMPPPPPTQLR
jgi:SAM-dependent methyltransferase